MAKLTGQTIASSYDQLLIVNHADGISSSLQAVESGDTGGSAAALQISTVAAAIDNPTASSATQGGKLTLFCDDGDVMASGHRLGVIEFGGAEDDGNTITTGARIEALADATWSDTENGADMVFYTTDGDASQSEVMRLTADAGTEFTGAVTMASSAVTMSSSSASEPILHITNTHAGATAGELRFNKDSASGDDNDVMGTISWYGTDAGEATHERLAYMDTIITDSAAGSEASSMRFYVAENDATLTQGLALAGQADADGEIDVTIGAGVASTCTVAGLLTVTGGGIAFPATQVASADANTLDDYEEGTWTPVLSDGSNNATAATAVGTYTKIGNLVTLRWLYTCSSLGSVSGNTRFTGLPFTPKNTANNQGVFIAGVAAGLGTGGGENIGGFCNPNEAFIQLQVWAPSTGSQALPQGNISDDGSLTMFGQYHTA